MIIWVSPFFRNKWQLSSDFTDHEKKLRCIEQKKNSAIILKWSMENHLFQLQHVGTIWLSLNMKTEGQIAEWENENSNLVLKNTNNSCWWREHKSSRSNKNTWRIKIRYILFLSQSHLHFAYLPKTKPSVNINYLL
jgi:hypothetical protein